MVVGYISYMDSNWAGPNYSCHRWYHRNNRKQMSDKKLELQNFLQRLNREPNPEELDKTPDGKAKTLPISFVEMTLDEIFLGQWSTENFTSKQMVNEVCGELELVVIHPITGMEIRRTGAASIIIMTDKVPDTVTGQARNEWALSPSNKKYNALDLGYPKLKAECVKNAAQSIGKIFGRDLNRKKTDRLQEEYKHLGDKGFASLVDRVEKGDIEALRLAQSNFILTDVQMEILKGAIPQQKQLGNG